MKNISEPKAKKDLDSGSNGDDKPKDEYGRKPIGDFVPYKIGLRMKTLIDFSV